MLLGSLHVAHRRSLGPQATLMSLSDWSETFTAVACWSHFVGFWLCSSCSFLHKGTDTGLADRLRIFYDPVHLSWSNCLSPGISSMLLKLGDTANLPAMADIDVPSWRSCNLCKVRQLHLRHQGFRV